MPILKLKPQQLKPMKKLLCLSVLLAILFTVQTAEAQSRKEKRKAAKNKANTEQVTPTDGKQNASSTKPSTVVVPASDTQQPDGKAPAQNTQDNNRKPQTAQSDTKPQQGSLSISDIVEHTKPVVTNTTNGSVNWTEQYIEAKGSSVIDNTKFTNPSQAKAMAIRGAVVVAQRNLLEIIKGVNVTSETTVKDMMTQGDFIYTRVDGVIKGAQQVGEAIEKDGMMEVKMRVPLYERNGLAAALYNDVPQNKNIQISPETQQQLTKELQDQVLNGLAFNLNGKNFDPSLFPVIVDENGKLVFDFSKVYDPTKGEFPKFFNATENFFKELGYDKGVEFIDILRTEPGKIVLDNKNVKKINWNKIAKTAGTIGKFLMMFI